MKADSPTCPSRKVIQAFLLGQISPEQSITLDDHLSQCPTCLSVLDDCCADDLPRPPDLSETREAIPTDDAMPLGNRVVPRFDEVILRKRIGSGGFGDVYLAEQRNTNDRPVAVKILHHHLVTPEAKRSFRQEVASLIRLKHENIARIYQKCVADDGTVGVVMEHIDGRSLTECARDKNFSADNRLLVADMICDAIEHIHQAGLVHRDLTPQNIMLVSKDGHWVPKIIDFGLSFDSARSRWMSFPGAGTTSYMAPEQAGRLNEDVTVSSDIYSLGLCLFELWTGQKPATSRDGETTTAYFDRKINAAFRLPSLNGFTGLKQALSTGQIRELDSILAKAISLQPQERYASVKAMRSDVMAVRKRVPTSLRANDRVHRGQLFVRRNFITISVSSIFAGLLIGARGVVVAERTITDDVITQSGDYVKKMVDRANPLITPALPTATDEESIDFAASVGEEVQDLDFRDTDPFLIARMTAANTLQSLDSPSMSVGELEAIVDSCRDQFGVDADDTLAAQMHLAHAYLSLNRSEEAYGIYKNAFDIWNSRYGIHDNRTLAAVHYVSIILLQYGRNQTAIELSDKIIEHYRGSSPDGDLMLVAVHLIRGRSFLGLGRYREAIFDFEFSERGFLEAGLGASHPSIQAVNGDIALAESRLGDSDSAIRRMTQVVRETERVYPSGAAAIDLSRLSLAKIMIECGQINDGIKVLQVLAFMTRHSDVKTNANAAIENARRKAENHLEASGQE